MLPTLVVQSVPAPSPAHVRFGPWYGKEEETMKHLNMAMVAALVLGQAAYGSVITYSAVLLGTSEVPPTGSPGTGQATVIINTLAQTDRKSTRLNSSHLV